jgi:prepilin signal peptidase PulO-like enzyme (type II secretory pathway)
MLIVILLILGLILGSFVNALVWRIHEQERLISTSTKVRKNELAQLSIMRGRSMCPTCHHQLMGRDLIPVFSWIYLKGKCRYCSKPISWQYPIVELMVAALFELSYVFWPQAFHGIGLLEFAIWLLCLIGFIALAVYDLRWYILPNRILYPLFTLILAQILIVSLFLGGGRSIIVSSFWGILIGGGIFYVLYQVSGAKWIGGGDVKLGALLGIIVGGPLNAILFLFLASLTGSLVFTPLLASGKVKRTTLIPFGPFLLVSAVIVRLFGSSVINYLQIHNFLPT